MSISQSEAVETQAAHPEEAAGSTARAAFRQLRRSPTAIIGAILIAIFVFVALFAPAAGAVLADGRRPDRPAAGRLPRPVGGAPARPRPARP
jgi:hypothetical protein